MHGAIRIAHRILTVSKPWVTVTAPHAAMPPAMKDPRVVDMFCASLPRRHGQVCVGRRRLLGLGVKVIRQSDVMRELYGRLGKMDDNANANADASNNPLFRCRL